MNIVQHDNPVLREVSIEVSVKDISSEKIQKVLHDMKKALYSQDDGVAIAAPQIGVPLRIFLVSGKIFDKNFEAEDYKPAKTKTWTDFVFINPEIIKLSKKKEVKFGEGCLSVRWLYGEVERATNATITAYDEHGVKFTRGAGGLLAHIFQHEIDHLDGILFIDKAKHLEEIPPQKQHHARKKSA